MTRRLRDNSSAKYREEEGWIFPGTPVDKRAPRDNRGSATKGMPLGEYGGCWCGGPPGHDWEGKDDGEPHPR